MSSKQKKRAVKSGIKDKKDLEQKKYKKSNGK